jgi:hypothetical protein
MARYMSTYDNDVLLALVRLLAPEDATLVEEVRLAMNDPETYISTFYDRLDVYGISKPIDSLPWIALTDGLPVRSLLSNIDWKERCDVVIDEINTLINRNNQSCSLEKGMSLDDMVSDELLKSLGSRLVACGLALISLDLDSDNYPVSVVTHDKVSDVQDLVRRSGYGNMVWWKN